MGRGWFLERLSAAAALKAWKAAMNSRWFVEASLMASFTRRTLTLTTAPIFSSRSLIVLAQARASVVPGSPMRRSVCIST